MLINKVASRLTPEVVESSQLSNALKSQRAMLKEFVEVSFSFSLILLLNPNKCSLTFFTGFGDQLMWGGQN